MSKEQRKMFGEMMDEMAADAKGGVEITAVHAADKINKLRQILCGVVHDQDTGKYVALDNTPRLLDLIAAIHEAQAKVIVIVPFKGIIRLLQAQLSTAGITMGVLNGDVSVSQRRTVIEDFKSKPKADMAGLLCHPKVMAHGLNLTEADMTIFYAPIFSYDEYAQVIERMNRSGQMLSMTVLRMGAHPVEWAIYRTLDDRGMTQRTILDLYDEVTIRKAA
jgi:SNF2 family DNA or RNA helicase